MLELTSEVGDLGPPHESPTCETRPTLTRQEQSRHDETGA